jgi:hypothetical protein
MNESERLIRCDNAMVALLTPQELEKFAEIDRIEQESKAAIAQLLEKVKKRTGLSGWRDEESPEELAILENLPPEDREFYRSAYPEELEEYAEATTALGEALQAKAKFYRIAGLKMP